MSRIGPGGQSAVRTPQRRQTAEHEAYDAYGAPQQGQQPYPQQGQQGGYYGQPQQGYGDHPGYSGQGQGYGQQGYAEQGYGGYAQPQSSYPAHQAQAPFVPAPHPFGQPQGYGADFDPPTQPPRGYAGQGYGQDMDPTHGRGFAPHSPAQPMPFDRFPSPQPQGYGQPQTSQPGWGQQQSDPRGLDGGQFMPSAAAAPQHAEPGFQVGPQDHFNQPQQDYSDHEGAYDESEIEDEAEPRRGRRTLMIVAALVGAIGLGGAMAYTYKSFSGRATVAKTSDPDAARVKAASVNSDKKVATRLEGSGLPGSQSEPESPSDDPNAPRKVRIIPITGGNEPPAQTASAPPAPGIPGIMVDMGTPPPSRPQPNQGPAPIARATPAAAPVAANAGPKPAAQAPVRTVAVNPPAEPQAEPAAPAAKREKVAKVTPPKVKDDQTASIPSSASGFVSVLSSSKTRIDALKAFAEVQQKHNDILESKQPDVQEVNLGEKGMRYRAIVGPPGSYAGAKQLCDQLETGGFKGCWVKPY